jgi:glycosyltransferase involved in cell wall biosynthesis
MSHSDIRIAVLIPCYNEAVAIAETVLAFRRALPTATVHVYDNNSTDDTATIAWQAGAVVRRETMQGKGNVVRRMFADVEADVYVLVDGDATYDAAAAPAMIDRLLTGHLDMVVARRVHTDAAAYRAGHTLGNKLFTGFLAKLFGARFTDILSGYRVFSRRFVKTFPALTRGFEIETELSVHALHLPVAVDEIDVAYAPRPEGSHSKLGTYRDGARILRLMLSLFKNERPLAFFGVASSLLATLSIVLGAPVLATYLDTGLVPRFPTAILAASIMILACLAAVCGTILETVTRGRREAKRLAYLGLPRADAASRAPLGFDVVATPDALRRVHDAGAVRSP